MHEVAVALVAVTKFKRLLEYPKFVRAIAVSVISDKLFDGLKTALDDTVSAADCVFADTATAEIR